MDYRNKLLLDDIVELVVSEGEYIGKYRTRIEEIGDSTLLVGVPIDNGVVIPLREGTKVQLVFCDQESAYYFEGKIMQRIPDPIPMLILEMPDKVVKIQRRNYFRIPVLYPLSFQVSTEEGLSDLQKGTALDLSGGGLRFITKTQVENGALLHVHLKMPKVNLKTMLQVVRTESVGDSKQYMVSGEFQDITERDRDQIIHDIYDIQRAMFKKGQV